MSTKTASASTTIRRRLGAVVLSLAALGMVGLGARPASADTAHNTGWHTVCAVSLTQYNNGYLQTLNYGDAYLIEHFAGNHVWGWGFHDGGSGYYGWVNNGWFC